MDGQTISFAQYLREMGGTDVIYFEECEEVIKKWNIADWAYVDDYIAPIAAEVITRASEVDRESYEKIMSVISEVYEKMRPEPDKPQLIRIK